MADIIGEGSATVGGLSSNVEGSKQGWVPSLDLDEGWVSPTLTPTVFTQQDASDLSSADVQLQVSVSPTFGTTVHDSDMTQPHNTSQGRQVTGLTDGVTYYVRARVKKNLPSGYTYTSAWTTTVSFTVVTKSGIASIRVTMNIGVAHTPVRSWPVYAYENVGVMTTLVPFWAAYAYENVGVENTPRDFVSQYVYEGDVNTLTPEPVIWFLLPSYGREGDGIDIVGFGFGDLQSTYGGVVEIDWGGVTGWQSVPIISWQTFPPTVDAYTGDRMIDEIIGQMDPQHTVIQISVPAGAIPPGYPIRIRTEGP